MPRRPTGPGLVLVVEWSGETEEGSSNSGKNGAGRVYLGRDGARSPESPPRVRPTPRQSRIEVKAEKRARLDGWMDGRMQACSATRSMVQIVESD